MTQYRTGRKVGDIHLSELELTSIKGGETFVLAFLNSWPPRLILTLAKGNFALSGVVRFYVSKVWDVEKMLKMWFRVPKVILNAMSSTNSLICGPAVVRFFERQVQSHMNLDIITTSSGIPLFIDAMDIALYGPCTEESPEQMAVTLDPSSTPMHQVVARSFVFPSLCHNSRTVSVHWVRGDPREFLISCGYSK